MTIFRRRAIAALVAAALAVPVALSMTSTAGAGEGSSPRPPARGGGGRPPASLDDVRRATARYHRAEAAVADGFVATEECATHATLGGMGIHYVNPARLADASITATEPEILVYEPQPGGGLRLVAVEWFSVDPDQDLATTAGRPELFGSPFDGPMPGHDAAMPIHYDLHAWIWKDNPAGVFSPWNPSVTCDR